MSYEVIAVLMFSSMMLMLLTGQRVFAAIGFETDEVVPAADLAPVHLHGLHAVGVGHRDDLYKMFHVWFGP